MIKHLSIWAFTFASFIRVEQMGQPTRPSSRAFSSSITSTCPSFSGTFQISSFAALDTCDCTGVAAFDLVVLRGLDERAVDCDDEVCVETSPCCCRSGLGTSPIVSTSNAAFIRLPLAARNASTTSCARLFFRSRLSCSGAQQVGHIWFMLRDFRIHSEQKVWLQAVMTGALRYSLQTTQ